ncbi:MAG TPA: Spy/CpxP family protein refolding chaperone [Pyrinomonadaceae bacterium]|jgi:Spy/CpxP family protein refolding chaperone|nr:Spy/CpxP family protein refolding chaperone [Pyrinomonadaceae bacterium]
MNKANGRRAHLFISCALSLLFIILFSAQAPAQGGAPAQTPHDETAVPTPGARDGVGGRRGDPLRALNLSPDQLREIRAIREQNREEWRAVRLRLAEAHRALDEAIYADQINEALIEERAREVGAAQAAVARMRAVTELRIRRVMTPEQLNTLRTMREQARAESRTRQENRMGARQRQRRERLGRRDNRLLQRQNLDNPGAQPNLRRDDEPRGGRP